MIDSLTRLAQRRPHPPVAVASLVGLVEGLNPRLEARVRVNPLQGPALVVKGAPAESDGLEKVCQSVFVPQSEDREGFFPSVCFLARTKASNFFRTSTSARKRRFSRSNSSRERESSNSG